MRVAVIGLGAMGQPIATRLAGEFEVVGYDSDADRRALVDEAGVRSCTSPSHAVESAEVVVLVVRDEAQAEDALHGSGQIVASMPRDAVVVITSTVGPHAVRRLARAAPEPFNLVDAPMSGGPVRAARGTLVMMVSASRELLARVRPVLDRLATTLTVVGERVGDAQVLKAINQLLAGVHIAAAAEAIALARGLGVDPRVVLDTLSAGAAGSFMLTDRGPRMIQAYEGGAEVRSRVDIFVKDMGIVTSVARDAHVPTPLAAASEQLYLLAERVGLGSSDDSSIVTLLSPMGE